MHLLFVYQKLLFSLQKSFDFSSILENGSPSTTHTPNSPSATSPPCKRKLIKWNGPSIKKISSSRPMIIPFKSTGIKLESTGSLNHFMFLNLYTSVTATKVAKVPKMMSSGSAPTLKRFDTKVPTVNPHIADGVKSASKHRISDRRNCTAIDVVPGSKSS